jgi:hypothetical protein
VASFALLLLTILATLGSGEHYLADLIVAPPLVLTVQAFCSSPILCASAGRFSLGAVLTLAWLVSFRTGLALEIPSGAAVWSLAVVSSALPAAAAYWADV